jgi:hypothetical protein
MSKGKWVTASHGRRMEENKGERKTNIISNQWTTAVAAVCSHCKIPFGFNGK